MIHMYDLNEEFSYERKKKIIQMIENLKEKKHYIGVFRIIKKDSNNFTQNSNGIFFNLDSLESKTLIEIESYLFKIKDNDSKSLYDKNKKLIKMFHNNEKEELSDYEKQIIKKHRNNSNNDNSSENYETI